jgi:hypothetical protein
VELTVLLPQRPECWDFVCTLHRGVSDLRIFGGQRTLQGALLEHTSPVMQERLHVIHI